jgi:hypothetical protein
LKRRHDDHDAINWYKSMIAPGYQPEAIMVGDGTGNPPPIGAPSVRITWVGHVDAPLGRATWAHHSGQSAQDDFHPAVPRLADTRRGWHRQARLAKSPSHGCDDWKRQRDKGKKTLADGHL